MRVGYCVQCGNCCRSICLEDSSGWLTSKKDLIKLLKSYLNTQDLKYAGATSPDICYLHVHGVTRMANAGITITVLHYAENIQKNR